MKVETICRHLSPDLSDAVRFHVLPGMAEPLRGAPAEVGPGRLRRRLRSPGARHHQEQRGTRFRSFPKCARSSSAGRPSRAGASEPRCGSSLTSSSVRQTDEVSARAWMTACKKAASRAPSPRRCSASGQDEEHDGRRRPPGGSPPARPDSLPTSARRAPVSRADLSSSGEAARRGDSGEVALASAMNTGTPMREHLSASTCSVTVLPVPVAPATRPWRFASPGSRHSTSDPVLASASGSLIAGPSCGVTICRRRAAAPMVPDCRNQQSVDWLGRRAKIARMV